MKTTQPQIIVTGAFELLPISAQQILKREAVREGISVGEILKRAALRSARELIK